MNNSSNSNKITKIPLIMDNHSNNHSNNNIQNNKKYMIL